MQLDHALATHHPTISALVLAHNEAKLIANCIETLRWCDEVIVLDNNSSDTTAEIAERLGARVVSFASTDFSRLRNELLKRAKTDWVFYIDADERVTPSFAREVLVQIETSTATALRCNRRNILYGKQFLAGGWNQDLVTRVFKRDSLSNWFGAVHESPKFSGEIRDLHSELLHFTHRSTAENLIKTKAWTAIEAQLLYEGAAAKVTLTTLLRKPAMEVVRRIVFKAGYKDGLQGWIEALVQAANKLFVYVQLWELQQKPSLEKMYQQQEENIAKQWQSDREIRPQPKG